MALQQEARTVPGFLAGDDKGVQRLVAGMRQRRDHDLRHVRVRCQRCLYLAKLDAMALHLHLEVLAAEEFDRCRRGGPAFGVRPEAPRYGRKRPRSPVR